MISSDSSLEDGQDWGIHFVKDKGSLLTENVYKEIAYYSIQRWLELHEEDITQKIIEGYTLQPKKKKQKKM